MESDIMICKTTEFKNKTFHLSILQEHLNILNKMYQCKEQEQNEIFNEINLIEDKILQNRIHFYYELTRFQNDYSIDATDRQNANFLEQIQLIQSTEYQKSEVIKSCEIVKIENEIFELEEKIKFLEDELKIEREMMCLEIDNVSNQNELNKEERLIESLQLKLRSNMATISRQKLAIKNREQMGCDDFDYNAIELNNFGGIILERFEF